MMSSWSLSSFRGNARDQPTVARRVRGTPCRRTPCRRTPCRRYSVPPYSEPATRFTPCSQDVGRTRAGCTPRRAERHLVQPCAELLHVEVGRHRDLQQHGVGGPRRVADARVVRSTMFTVSPARRWRCGARCRAVDAVDRHRPRPPGGETGSASSRARTPATTRSSSAAGAASARSSSPGVSPRARRRSAHGEVAAQDVIEVSSRLQPPAREHLGERRPPMPGGRPERGDGDVGHGPRRYRRPYTRERSGEQAQLAERPTASSHDRSRRACFSSCRGCRPIEPPHSQTAPNRSARPGFLDRRHRTHAARHGRLGANGRVGAPPQVEALASHHARVTDARWEGSGGDAHEPPTGVEQLAHPWTRRRAAPPGRRAQGRRHSRGRRAATARAHRAAATAGS